MTTGVEKESSRVRREQPRSQASSTVNFSNIRESSMWEIDSSFKLSAMLGVREIVGKHISRRCLDTP